MVEIPEFIMEEDVVEDLDPLLLLPTYVAPHKSSLKVPKDMNNVWSYINSSLIPKYVSFEGDMFAKNPLLEMEDWDFADQDKFLELAPSMYLDSVAYNEGVIKVKLKHWELVL